MAEYRHTQPGALILQIMLLVVAVEIVIGFAINQPIVWSIIGVVCAVLLAIGWLFSSLTVEVSKERLSWQFGPGFFKKSIERSDIVSAEPVVTKWWYGWGIRLTPKGWLYNVSGFDAVAVKQKSGRTTLIGTDQPQELAAALGF